jgi:hypothetical protein
MTTIHSCDSAFTKIVSAVIWTDALWADGNEIVPIDPEELAAKFNDEVFPLFKEHDPGIPIGGALEAKAFTDSNGKRFVAAVFGIYDGKHMSFGEVGFDPTATVLSPPSLPELGSAWIDIAADPRDVNEAWIDDVMRTAPLPVKRRRLSLNAAEAHSDALTIGLTYLVLVWNPFVTAIATEAGKDLYAATRNWVRSFLGRLSERRNPIVEIKSHLTDECCVSFMFRGNDVTCHYAAHDSLPQAAEQAAQLAAKMKRRDFAAKRIVYEFSDNRWYPSYAVLCNGRLVTDNKVLIAIEQLPSQLSLGIAIGEPRAPNANKP